VIQEQIKKPLAEQLLFGDLVTGGHVRVEIVDDKPSFTITPSKAPLKKEGADEGLDPDAIGDGEEEPKEPQTVK
jgi:ATP-dependent Clp protease ATP-binding subunit ClpA